MGGPRPGCSGLVLDSKSSHGGQAIVPGEGWGGGGCRPSSHLLPWRDCPVRPAAGERKKGRSAEGEWREGLLRAQAGLAQRSCGLWAVWGAAGKTSSRPFPHLPSHPDTARDQAAFSGSSPSRRPDGPHLLPLPREPGTTEGGNGAWRRSEQGRGWGACTSRGV